MSSFTRVTRTRKEVIDVNSPMSTADLPLSFYAEPAVFEAARTAIAAGVTLDRTACSCSPSRSNCPPCLTATLRSLAPA